jgi:hypothetical protein
LAFAVHGAIAGCGQFLGDDHRGCLENKTELDASSGSDRTISPDLERWYARRAHSHTVEVAGPSHGLRVGIPRKLQV